MQEYWTQPATYDPLAFDTRFRPELLDVWLPHFVELAGVAAQHRVLDLGCGTGGFARALAQRLQAEVIGVDVAAHLLRHAAVHSPALPLRWVLGQAEALPLADQTVDRVLMSLVLHQITQRQQALQEVYRVLRPGGRGLHTRTVCRNARVDLHKVTEELRQRTRPSYRLLTDAELEDGLHRIAQEWCAKGGQWIDPKPHVLITAVK